MHIKAAVYIDSVSVVPGTQQASGSVLLAYGVPSLCLGTLHMRLTSTLNLVPGT